MESKEYFEKVMQDYNQHHNGRSLRKYCKDEAIDYDWVIKFKKPILSDQQKRKNHQKVLSPLLSLTSLPLLWNGLLNIWFSDLPKVMSLKLRVQVCLSWHNCCIRCHRPCYNSQRGQSISLIPVRQICVRDVRGLRTL